MAIYIGLKAQSEDELTKVYSFFRSDESPYGTLAVDKKTYEIELLDSIDDKATEFAYPRACRAIKKSIEKNELPDELCYAS